jgi:urease accessory protein
VTDLTGTLTLCRLADSFLPVGAYTASYGLEQFVADDQVTDAEDLQALLSTYLRGQVGPSDVVVLAHAHRAAAEGDLPALLAADRRLTAVTMVPEFRGSSTTAGDRLLDIESRVRDDPFVGRYAARIEEGAAPGNYVVAFAAVAARDGVDVRDCALAHGHAFVTGLLGAAQRLLSLGHTEAQAILVDLQPTIEGVVDDHLDRSLDAIEPFAPGIDLAGMAHERADRRLFVS